jgi:hypothetical protein
MKATLSRLREIGYQVEIEENEIVCVFKGADGPDCSVVLPLLNDLKRHKDEYVETLKKEKRASTEPEEGEAQPVHKLVALIRWAEQEAHRIASIINPSEQMGALQAFEDRCAQFDALPKSLKQEALELAHKGQGET